LYPYLLEQSLETAERASKIAAEFARDFTSYLSNDSISQDLKRRYIELYIQKLDHEIDKSANQSQGFVDLALHLRNIKNRWVALSKQHNLKTGREEIIGDLNRMRDLAAQVSGLQDEIANTFSKADRSLDKLFGAIRLILPTYFSTKIVPHVVKGNNESAMKLMELEFELFRQEVLVKRKLNRCDPAARLDVFLNDEGGEYSRTRDKVHAFATIWAHIRRDVVLIENGLESAYEDDEHEFLFRTRLEAAKVVYEELYTGLEKYCEVIRQNKD